MSWQNVSMPIDLLGQPLESCASNPCVLDSPPSPSKGRELNVLDASPGQELGAPKLRVAVRGLARILLRIPAVGVARASPEPGSRMAPAPCLAQDQVAAAVGTRSDPCRRPGALIGRGILACIGRGSRLRGLHMRHFAAEDSESFQSTCGHIPAIETPPGAPGFRLAPTVKRGLDGRGVGERPPWAGARQREHAIPPVSALRMCRSVCLRSAERHSPQLHTRQSVKRCQLAGRAAGPGEERTIKVRAWAEHGTDLQVRRGYERFWRDNVGPGG